MVDHVVKDAEQLFLIKELLKALSHAVVLLKHKLEFFGDHLVDHVMHRVLLLGKEFRILLELGTDLTI